MDMDKNKFAEEFRKRLELIFRKSEIRGYSELSRLIKKTGYELSEDSIPGYMNGPSLPGAYALACLAIGLEVSVDSLLGLQSKPSVDAQHLVSELHPILTEIKNCTDPAYQEIVDLLSQLPVDKKEKARKIIVELLKLESI